MRYSIIGDTSAENHGGRILPGGSGAIALALVDLGGTVTLRSALGKDAEGKAVRDTLKAARIHPGLIDLHDGTPTLLVTRDESGAVAQRREGVGIEKGIRLDVYELFLHDALLLDTFDQPMRRFISDLPAHTVNNVRMVGTIRHLDIAEPTEDETEIAMRFDAVVGTEAQFHALTGQDNATDALADLYDLMPGRQLRAAIAVTSHGIEIVSREDRVLRPVQDAIPDLLLPQVTAAVAWGLAHRRSWDDVATVGADPSMANRVLRG